MSMYTFRAPGRKNQTALRERSKVVGHELSIFRVAILEVKVTWFIKNNFCLIAGLRCDKPYDLEVEPSNIWLLTKYFPQKFGFVGESIKGKGKSVKGKGKVKTAPKKATKKVSVTCAKLERAFKECEDEDDVLNMGLVYFPKSNVGVNLEYLDLVEDKDRFNTYS
ncbi:hypothetical protein DVH24_007954 [Malus domestica]|uniref:Uncharacterized protein n=1 Tax=Malus domestica TaxID=3750 RepID=A0A498JNN4_MALDO|nr:hypothetical protein DVH24_007954 [Malus domestica]